MPCANCRRVLTALPNEDGNINGGDDCSIFLLRNAENEPCVGQEEPIQDIPISVMISTVFEANLKLHKKQVPSDCRLLMCFQCLSALTSLNATYIKFMKLTVGGSYIQKLLRSSILWSSFAAPRDFESDPLRNDDSAVVNVKVETDEHDTDFPIIKEEDSSFVMDQLHISYTSSEDEAHLRLSRRKMRTNKLKGVVRNKVNLGKKVATSRQIPPKDKRRSVKKNVAKKELERRRTKENIKRSLNLEQNCTDHEFPSANSLTVKHHSAESAQNSSEPAKLKEPLLCPHNCETSFPSEARFTEHLKSVHGETPSFTCEECGKTYQRGTEYRRHLKYKHGHGLTSDDLEGRSCPDCPKVFGTKSQLKTHQISVHSTEKPFECEVEGCGRKFPTKNYLDIHRLYQHTKANDRCPCEICGKLLRDKNKLRMHVKAVHDGIRDIICEICGKAFTTRSELVVHMESHDKSRQKRFQCTVCNKLFISARSLRGHRLQQHSGVKQCNYCGDTFLQTVSLRRHLVAKHGVRPATGPDANECHECSQCGKVFKLKEYLRQHQRSKTHGGKGHTAQKRRESVA